MPLISLSEENHLNCLKGVGFKNKKMKGYVIGEIYEQISLKID